MAYFNKCGCVSVFQYWYWGNYNLGFWHTGEGRKGERWVWGGISAQYEMQFLVGISIGIAIQKIINVP